MKNLMIAIIGLAFLAGCSGQTTRTILDTNNLTVDQSATIDKEALCQDEIDKMVAAFNPATIKNKTVKFFFADAVEVCNGLGMDYITPVAELFVQNASTIKACQTTIGIKNRVAAELNAGTEKRFEEILTYYTTNPLTQCISAPDISDIDEADQIR